jgi:purine-nucleoside phosphorylase
MVIGTIEGRTCIVMQGRFHLYEGHEPEAVALPTRLMTALGARYLIVTNAAGGIAPSFRTGDLMLIEDHINLTGRNPLVGPVFADEQRFPDMSVAYDPALRRIAAQAAVTEDVQMVRGVYAAALGPSYETPAEVKMLSLLGAHAVGMSTVPEVIVARARGVPVLGISLISNAAAGISGEPLSHDEVMAAGERAGDGFRRLIRGIVRRLP